MIKPVDTRRSILDAAELFFARNGYRGTSLRTITGRAGVNLAAVNYHFGSKKRLLDEVIKRRILPLNKIRKKRLEEVRVLAISRGLHPDIEDVLTAFIEPTMLFKETEPGAKEFITFIGRSLADPDDTVRNAFHAVINPMARFLFKTVCEALPGLSKELLFWRLHFTMGAFFHTMHISGNPEQGLMGMKADIDAKSLVGLLIPYVTAGMKAR